MCLPDKLTLETFGVRVPFLAYAWNTISDIKERSKSSFIPLSMRHTAMLGVSDDKTGLLTMWCEILLPGVSRPGCLIFDIQGRKDLKDQINEEGASFRNDEEEAFVKSSGVDVAKISNRISACCLRTIIGMSAMPQLIDSNLIERPARWKKEKQVVSELWSPRYIGFKYKRVCKPDAPHGTHNSPRMHRKNGHWKAQVHGPNRTLRKLIWVDEYWVCVPEEEPIDAKT